MLSFMPNPEQKLSNVRVSSAGERWIEVRSRLPKRDSSQPIGRFRLHVTSEDISECAQSPPSSPSINQSFNHKHPSLSNKQRENTGTWRVRRMALVALTRLSFLLLPSSPFCVLFFFSFSLFLFLGVFLESNGFWLTHPETGARLSMQVRCASLVHAFFTLATVDNPPPFSLFSSREQEIDPATIQACKMSISLHQAYRGRTNGHCIQLSDSVHHN